jgi:hypothetical protein
MAPVLLALALLAQQPDQQPDQPFGFDPDAVRDVVMEIAGVTTEPPLPPADRARIDLGFTGAVEDFVRTSRPWAKPPKAIADDIEALGHWKWFERDAASKRLEALPPGDQRWLFWGRRNRDPEIRLRANGIIRRLNLCTNCKGIGRFDEEWYTRECWDCHGFGTLWPWSM